MSKKVFVKEGKPPQIKPAPKVPRPPPAPSKPAQPSQTQQGNISKK